MAAGIGNSAGFVQIVDGGVPRTFTGIARANISGGAWAFGSTADNVVSSGADTFITADFKFAGDASGLTVNGVVLQSTLSGGEVVIATRGAIIALADGTVTAGAPVIVKGNNAVSNVTVGSVASTEYPVGRALTSAGSEGYCVVHLNL